MARAQGLLAYQTRGSSHRSLSHYHVNLDTAARCNAWQHTATHCNALQRIATHCPQWSESLVTTHTQNAHTYAHTYTHKHAHMRCPLKLTKPWRMSEESLFPPVVMWLQDFKKRLYKKNFGFWIFVWSLLFFFTSLQFFHSQRHGARCCKCLMRHFAVCCSVLQCVAVRCSAL